jgi:hypothetical protein
MDIKAEIGAESVKDMGKVMAVLKERSCQQPGHEQGKRAGEGAHCPEWLNDPLPRNGWMNCARGRCCPALIGRTTKITKAGRELEGCCPFHNEKTPSFTVNDEKGFYHCFGCGAHGDAIRWMTDQRGLPFMDAVKELAAMLRAWMYLPPIRAQRNGQSAPIRCMTS